MSPKTKQIISWALAGLVGALFLFSASGKLMASEEGVKMAAKFGLDASTLPQAVDPDDRATRP